MRRHAVARARSDRGWIWIALTLQLAGEIVDVIWHGLAGPRAEPTTAGEMARHLRTVHLPLYLGAAGVLITTARALLRQLAIPSAPDGSRPASRVALSVALAGAVLSAAAESWHAYSHMHLDTRHAPLAGSLSVVGYLVAIAGTIWAGRRERRRGGGSLARRRAA